MTGKKLLSALWLGISTAAIIVITAMSIGIDVVGFLAKQITAVGKQLNKVRRKRVWIEVPRRRDRWY